MVRKYLEELPNEYIKYLTESQYNVCMKALGYTYDEELDKFLMGDNVFLTNISDDITEVCDLININENGHPTYMANVICNFMNKGAELIIGEGAIDGYGIKHKKALYCTNYRDLLSDKKRVRSK